MTKSQTKQQLATKVVAKVTDIKPVTANSMVFDERPDYLQNNTSTRGSENVTADDLVIPRLELVQSLSPCRKKTDPNYIEGAEEGMVYNNVTRQLYGTEVLIVPVFYRKEWLIWKSRDEGGGFRGAYSTDNEAENAMVALEDGEDCAIAETGQHFCLLIKPETGKIEEIVLSMSKSKLGVSKRFNSLIRINGGDSFSRVYRVNAIMEQNSKNQDYYNLTIKAAGFPTREVFDRAVKLYDSIKAGTVKVDRNEEVSTEKGESTEY